jgi:hypothetical protein
MALSHYSVDGDVGSTFFPCAEIMQVNHIDEASVRSS